MKKLLSAALLCLASALPALAQKAVTVEPEIAAGGYDNLNSAVTAAVNGTETDYTITLNQDEQAFTNTINPKGKNIIICGANPDITINLAPRSGETNLRTFVNLNTDAANGSITMKDVVIDGGNLATNSNPVFQQTRGTLSIENVRIQNFATTSANSMVRIYQTPTASAIDNLTFSNCTLPENVNYNIFYSAANSGLSLKGMCDFTVRLDQASSFIVNSGISEGSITEITYSSHTEDVPVVKNCDDIFKFNLNVAGKMLSPKENSLYAVNKANILLINDVDGVKTGTGYSALAGSAGAATNATTGAVIVVNENVNLTTSMNFAGKSIEIRGAKPDVAITLAADRALAYAAAADTHIDIRDLAITPQAELAYTSFIAQATTSDASVSFQNVTFKDCNTTNAALIRANAGGVWHIDGVTFENCSVTPASKADGTEVTPLVLTNNPGCSVSGINNGLTIQVNNAGTNSIDAQGLEAGNEPIILTLSGAAHDHTLITNCENLSLFEITNSGWSFQADEQGGLKTLDRQIVTGVEEVAAEADGEAEYFDLRGVRVSADALTPGLYICRKGGKVSKTVIR